MATDDPLPRNLARILDEKGRSGRSVALRAGLSASAIKHILTGASKRPSYSTLSAIAGELGVSVGDLTGQSDTEPPAPLRQPRQLVEDDAELSLLTYWRQLDDGERGYLLALIRGSKLGR